MAADRGGELQELLEEVRRIDVLSRRLVGGALAGGYSAVFRGAGLEFDTVREYVEGDDPRKVDWNVTARMGRPFVKEYTEEREQTLVFVLDISASMDGGFSHWSARQMAARVCACLALAAVRSDDKVGLIACSEGVDRYVPAAKGVPHALRVVRDCLAQRPAGRGSRLAAALEFASRVVPRHAIVFVVSDFLAGDWERALSLCARRHDVVAVRVLTPELDAPARGMMRLRDPETGSERVVDWGSARVRRAYAESVAAWRARTSAAIGRANVDLMDVRVPRERDTDAIARPIRRFFRMREERGAKR